MARTPTTGVGTRLRKAAARLKTDAGAKARRALLMPHEERQALIRRPFFVTYFPPLQRHGGVTIIDDETWMRDANAWRHKYARDGHTKED